MKFKSKTGCLGEKISILPWQMAEQLAVEVDVKNVTEDGTVRTDTQTSSFIWLGLYYIISAHYVCLILAFAGSTPWSRKRDQVSFLDFREILV